MRLPEQRLYDWLQRKWGGAVFVERIENRVKRDTPDMFVAYQDLAGWVELKVLDEFPKRATTAVRVSHWTTGQRYWMSRAACYGVKTWLVVRVRDEVFVFDGQRAVHHVDKWTQAEWRKGCAVLNCKTARGQDVLDALRKAC